MWLALLLKAGKIFTQVFQAIFNFLSWAWSKPLGRNIIVACLAMVLLFFLKVVPLEKENRILGHTLSLKSDSLKSLQDRVTYMMAHPEHDTIEVTGSSPDTPPDVVNILPIPHTSNPISTLTPILPSLTEFQAVKKFEFWQGDTLLGYHIVTFKSLQREPFGTPLFASQWKINKYITTYTLPEEKTFFNTFLGKIVLVGLGVGGDEAYRKWVKK